jgi:hypothetical protein
MRPALTLVLLLSALCASCTTSMGPRAHTHLEIASTIGGARHAAYWWSQDLNPQTYPGADPRELDRLRARCEILSASADQLAARLDQQDMFAPGKSDPELDELASWAREIDDQRIDLGRELDILKVSLGMRPATDVAPRAHRSAPPALGAR